MQRPKIDSIEKCSKNKIIQLIDDLAGAINHSIILGDKNTNLNKSLAERELFIEGILQENIKMKKRICELTKLMNQLMGKKKDYINNGGHKGHE